MTTKWSATPFPWSFSSAVIVWMLLEKGHSSCHVCSLGRSDVSVYVRCWGGRADFHHRLTSRSQDLWKLAWPSVQRREEQRKSKNKQSKKYNQPTHKNKESKKCNQPTNKNKQPKKYNQPTNKKLNKNKQKNQKQKHKRQQQQNRTDYNKTRALRFHNRPETTVAVLALGQIWHQIQDLSMDFLQLRLFA